MVVDTPHGRAAHAMRRYTGAAHRGTNCTNVEASQNYGICCAQRPDQAPAWLASRSAREETSMKKLAIRREHRINETQAESAIKDYVDHVADIAKFPDGTGVPPTSTHPSEAPCPPASTPRPLPGWHPTYVPHYHGFASCWGCSPGAARKTAKPTHPEMPHPARPEPSSTAPPPNCATARAASNASYRSPTPLMMTRSARR